MATDQTWLARLLYPDHFNEAGERIEPAPPTTEPEPDPAREHTELLGRLLGGEAA